MLFRASEFQADQCFCWQRGNTSEPVLCCAAIDNLPQHRPKLPALQPALLALPGKKNPAWSSSQLPVQSCKETQSSTCSLRHQLRRKEEKPAHTALAAGSVLDRAGEVCVSTFCSPLVSPGSSTDPSVALGQLSLQKSTEGAASTIPICAPELWKDNILQ